MESHKAHVIIAGYGIGGRFIAEYLVKTGIPFVVVERNAQTVRTQADLGVHVIEGDITDPAVLRKAGVESACVLALAVSDDDAAIRAAEAANAIRPEIHIIAATRWTSSGLKALQAGADEIIVAEQAVAREFYNRIAKYMCERGPRGDDVDEIAAMMPR